VVDQVDDTAVPQLWHPYRVSTLAEGAHSPRPTTQDVSVSLPRVQQVVSEDREYRRRWLLRQSRAASQLAHMCRYGRVRSSSSFYEAAPSRAALRKPQEKFRNS